MATATISPPGPRQTQREPPAARSSPPSPTRAVPPFYPAAGAAAVCYGLPAWQAFTARGEAVEGVEAAAGKGGKKKGTEKGRARRRNSFSIFMGT